MLINSNPAVKYLFIVCPSLFIFRWLFAEITNDDLEFFPSSLMQPGK